MTFKEALKIILKHEGGYVNHPRDPGGRTNLGVTQRVWESWVGRSVGEAEMRALTVEDVAPLYEKKYWRAVKAPELPAGLALHVFDFGVNAGPRRAIRYLQKTIGTLQDGLWGPMSRRALKKYLERAGERRAVERYGALRLGYYRKLRTFSVFGRGWTRRTQEVTAKALEWAS